MQDESHDHGHVHFVPQNTVFFDVRTCRRRRRGQTEGFARTITIYNYRTNDYLSAFPFVRWRQRQPGIVVGLQRGRFPSETLGLQTFSQAERDDPPRMDNKTPPKDADFQDISVRILGN